MEYAEIGQERIRVSRLCFGCAPMGGHDYGHVNDADSISAVHAALDAGINFFDTAAVYGLGRAEEVLGRALEGRRNKAVIASKGGLAWNAGGTITRDAAGIMRSLEDSLRRLRVDTIDIFQIHWPDPAVPLEQTLNVLEKARKAGKIRHIGISNFSVAEVLSAHETCRVETLQLSYNLLNRELETDMLSCCKKVGMKLLTHSTLARGFLSGRYPPGHKFSGSDTRPRSSYFSDESRMEKDAVLEELSRQADALGKTRSQMAVRWVLDNPLVSAAIIGFKNSKQVADVMLASDWTLTPQVYSRLCDLSTKFISNPLI